MSLEPNLLPPNPCLQGVLLVTRSRTGPRLVLHYPSDLGYRQAAGQRARDWFTSSDDESASAKSSSSSEEEYSGDSDDLNQHSKFVDPLLQRRLAQRERHSTPQADRTLAPRDSSDAGLETRGILLDKIYGWSVDGLAKLLAPSSRTWHKKRFELCLEDKCFLGCPIFAREDGTWGKKKKKQHKATTEDKEATSHGEPIPHEEMRKGSDENTIDPHSMAGTSTTSHSSDTPGIESSGGTHMTMFNLVFVMVPPAFEHQFRVKEMYENIVYKFAKALKHLQDRESYVWKEILTIVKEKERVRDRGIAHAAMWSQFKSASSLARAIASTFDNISRSQIAHLSLGPSLELSLQIPRATWTPYVSTPNQPQMPGLQLTTYDPLHHEEQHSQDGALGVGLVSNLGAISPHSALLLVNSADEILKDLAADGAMSSMDPALAGPLTYFVRNLRPTKTPLQISRMARGRLSLVDIQLLSQHLIQYRLAIAIPPLHPSHVYLPSANADFAKLQQAASAYAERYASLPGLVTMLSRLGRSPQPYARLIPSSDHKEAYMDILAWLLRGGWIMQLRTFAWVRIDPSVKAEVAHQMQLEDKKAGVTAANTLAGTAVEEEEGSLAGDGMSNEGEVRSRRISDSSGVVSAFSPRLRAQLAPPRPASQAGSTSSARTTVPLLALREKSSTRQGSGSSHDHSNRKQRLSTGSNRSLADLASHIKDDTEPRPDASDFETSVVLSPHRANAMESRWLQQIGSTLPHERLREAWPRLVRYFDGTHALEEIAMQEGFKRKELNPMLARLMDSDGVLRTVRHW